MRNNFYLHLETMPKGTAQQKRYNRRTGIYFKDNKLQTAEQTFMWALKPHRPKSPSEGPVKLTVRFYFDVKDKSRWGKPKLSKPDADNYVKLFIDCMVKTGHLKDDSIIWDLHVTKEYAEKATIYVDIEEDEGGRP